MDDFARSLGYAVIELSVGTVILVLLLLVLPRRQGLSRLLKVLVLIGWGATAVVFPVVAIMTNTREDQLLPTVIGAIAVFAIVGISFYMVGYPELKKTIKRNI